MKQILVLFGGCSPEYSVSLASAYGVLTHIDRSLYQPIPVGITREGAWRWYGAGGHPGGPLAGGARLPPLHPAAGPGRGRPAPAGRLRPDPGL